ncbi:MAG: hypothetical protein HRU06_04750 [Oceanospirillaceae bacterium]|nr:hypothetical protein [Oceanospirillaceae bacterium]
MHKSVVQYITGCVFGDNINYPLFAVESINLKDFSDNNTSAFAVYYEEEWLFCEERPMWSAVAIESARYPDLDKWVVVAMGMGGEVWELFPKQPSERLVNIPVQTSMTNLTTVDNTIFAIGMGRVCFRREADGTWVDISAPWPVLDEGIIGFTGMVGIDLSLIYAVGWFGEIWILSYGTWTKEDSGSNKKFNAVAITDEGVVYIVGDDGVVFKGRKGMWEPIDVDLDLNLTDVCIHNNEIFVSSNFDVYKLVDSKLISEFSELDDAPGTCFKLFSDKKNSLYSIGSYDIYILTDRWEKIA